MTVARKSLVIVILPLLIGLLLIAALSVCLQQTDREYEREKVYRDLDSRFSQLVFLDAEAGVALMHAWKTQDNSFLEQFEKSDKRISRIFEEVKVMRKRAITERNAAEEKGMRTHQECQKILRMMASHSKEFNFENLTAIMSAQDKLGSLMNNCFESLQKSYHADLKRAEISGHGIDRLKEQEGLILIAGLIANVIVTIWLQRFYTFTFITRLETISNNIANLKSGKPLLAELQGNDEIAALDRAFRAMSLQLAGAAEREQALYDNAGDVFFTLGEDLRFLRISKACRPVWGLTPEDLEGKQFAELLAAEEAPALAAMLSALSVTEPALTCESDVVAVGGQRLRTLWSIYWSERDKNYFCTAHNITERYNLERMKAAFLALAARDFDQPLKRIKQCFEALCKSETLPEFARARVDRALNTATRLASMVAELLQLDRPTGATEQLHLQMEKVGTTLNAAVRDIEELARSRTITIDVECAETEEWTVDSAKMIRVIINLLSNAIKFSPEGSKIELTAARQAGEDCTRIEVRDQGPGISAETASTLFLPYHQASASDGSRGKGTGLGLTISQKIVQAHGGEIGILNGTTGGTVFWFTVPDHPDKQNVVSASARSAPTQTLRMLKKVPRAEAPPAPTPKGFLSFMDSLTPAQKRSLLIGTPLVFQCTLVAGLSLLLLQGTIARERELKHRSFFLDAMSIAGAFMEGTIATNLDKTIDLHAAETMLSTIPARIERFRSKIVDHPYAAAQSNRMIATAEKALPLMEKFCQESKQEGASLAPMDGAIVVATTVGKRLDELRSVCEKHELEGPGARLRQLQWTALFAGLAANVLIALGIAVLFTSSFTRRLKVMAENTLLLAAHTPLSPRVPGTDDIALLDRSFHEMAADIDVARDKEQAYQEHSIDVIGTCDRDCNFESVSPASRTRWGIPRERLGGTSLMAIVPQSQQSEVAEFFSDIEKAQSHGKKEITISSGGRTIETLWSVSWFVRESCFFFVVHDITKRKELENAKREFLALVSHDLRSPMSTISALATLLLHQALGELSDEDRPFITEISTDANQMLELINDLLDLEKLEAGKMLKDAAIAPLSQIIQQAEEHCRARLARHSIQLVTSVEDTKVAGDIERLSQSITNLIAESAGYCAPGSQIELRTTDGDGQVRIEIATFGGSVSDAVLAALRDRMESLGLDEDAENRLRLPLARTIIQWHHGTLSVSNPNNNLVFTIKLPDAN